MAEKTVEADNLKDDEAGDKAGADKGGKPLPVLVLVVGLLVMLLTPVASFFVVKLSLPAQAPAEAAPAKKETAKSKEEPALAIFNLNSMLINVADTKGTRILKIAPHLVLSETEMLPKLAPIKTMLIDTITTVASAKTLDELDGPAGRENLKKDILTRVNKLLESRMTGSVADVYFDEFLIQ